MNSLVANIAIRSITIFASLLPSPVNIQAFYLLILRHLRKFRNG